jgi:hypothetical protein
MVYRWNILFVTRIRFIRHLHGLGYLVCWLRYLWFLSRGASQCCYLQRPFKIRTFSPLFFMFPSQCTLRTTAVESAPFLWSKAGLWSLPLLCFPYVVFWNFGANTSWVLDLRFFVFFWIFFGQMNSLLIHYCIAGQHYLLYSPCLYGNFSDSCVLNASAFKLKAYDAIMCSAFCCYCTVREEEKFKCVR